MSRGAAVRFTATPGGNTLQATEVFETYWRFAAERQAIFMKRAAGDTPPWTGDSVLSGHRFTNVYRASDRVSQYLIRNVLYEGPQSAEELFFRAMLFKLFNKIETWEHLVARLGVLTWRTFDCERYARVLDAMRTTGARLYSAAYIMPSPSFGYPQKHRNHLRLLDHMMRDGAAKRFFSANSLKEGYEALRAYPSLGPFLAYQFAIDLNYSALTEFSEMDFVVAGPGAIDGIRKCFSNAGGIDAVNVIRWVTETASSHFARLGLTFQTLWGRPLQLIDCQNLFCEVSKYARVVHPEVSGSSKRRRIKQRYTPVLRGSPQWYPPKWGLSVPKVQRRAEG